MFQAKACSPAAISGGMITLITVPMSILWYMEAKDVNDSHDTPYQVKNTQCLLRQLIINIVGAIPGLTFTIISLFHESPSTLQKT